METRGHKDIPKKKSNLSFVRMERGYDFPGGQEFQILKFSIIKVGGGKNFKF